MNRRLFTIAAAAALAALACGSGARAEPAAKDVYQAASQANGFAVGAPMAVNVVYVFFDPKCPHCAHLWGTVKPLLGRLKVVWIPVGILGDSSVPQGATILSAANPAEAMERNETLVLDHQPGIPVDPALGADALAKVKANTDLLEKLGADSVPLIVYRNPRTGEHGAVSGALETTQLAAMLGV